MTAVKAVHNFPPQFLWGTATASHQVEGGNSNNDWSQWEQQPGRIDQGQKAGKACDWWGGRWRQDLDRAADAGQNSHRLSLEWSRLEPNADGWDSQAAAVYREILEGIRARGMTPMVTLHHFTNPIWLMEMGGWESERVIDRFQRYTEKAIDTFGDLAGLWVTINEPNVYAYAAYASGDFPPGQQDINRALLVMVNMIKAHARAYHAIHQRQPNAQVGLAHHYRSMVAVPSINPLHQLVASLRSKVFNTLIPDACASGEFRLPWRRISLEEARGTQDFFGLNYYTREYVRFDPFHWSEFFGRGQYAAEAELSANGFIANEPEGFWEALKWAEAYGLPIYVTENGVEDDDDGMRRRYLVQHIRKLWKAVNFNWRVKGYFHWTLVDNFEWERGWSQRFGLWALDPETQDRVKRGSADLYAAICKSGSLSSEIVAEFTPELVPVIFPPAVIGELTDASTAK